MAQRKATNKTASKLAELFEPTESEQDFDEFMDEIGETASIVEIYRVERSEQQQLDRVTFDDVRADPYGYLRERFGVGKYRMKFKAGDYKYKGHRTLIIGDQSKATGAAPAAAGNTFNEFMEKQLALQQTLMLGLVSAIKPPAPPDIGSMMQGLGAIMQGAPKSDPAAMFTAMVTALATLKPENKDEDSLTRAGKIIEMVKAFIPETQPDSVLGVVRDIGKEVVSRFSASFQPMPAQLPPGQTITTPMHVEARGADAIEAPVSTAAAPPANDQAAWCRVAIAYLKSKAQLGKDSENIVTFMFECAEEPQWNAILGAVQHGATFENLLQFDPEIGENPQLKAWFQKLYDDIHTEIFKSVDTGGESGNRNNVEHNEAIGAAGSVPS